MSVSHLYLLVEADGEAFKIGKADDPTRRAATLPNRIDYGRSLAFSFPARFAIRAEKTLHFLFRAHRISGRPRQDGSTEWFRMRAFDDVKRFLWVNRELLGWMEWRIVEAPADKPGRPRGPDFTMRAMDDAERAARIAGEQLANERAKERKARAKEAAVAVADFTAEAFASRGLELPSRRGRKSFKAKSGPVTRTDPRTGVKTITTQRTTR